MTQTHDPFCLSKTSLSLTVALPEKSQLSHRYRRNPDHTYITSYIGDNDNKGLFPNESKAQMLFCLGEVCKWEVKKVTQFERRNKAKLKIDYDNSC